MRPDPSPPQTAAATPSPAMTWLRRVFTAVLAASTLISLGSQAWDRSRMALAAQRLGPHAVAPEWRLSRVNLLLSR